MSFVLSGWLYVDRINGPCFVLEATCTNEFDSVKNREFGDRKGKRFETVFNFASCCTRVAGPHYILRKSTSKKCRTITVYYSADRYNFLRWVFGHSGFVWKD